MYLNKDLGKIGEDLACDYLLKNNYKIICKNFLCRQGEIDIVAKDFTKNELVFFEVKTRTNFHYGRPIDAININKQQHIYAAANYYVYKNFIYDTFIRFDVIEVLLKNNSFEINHIKQIEFSKH